MKFIFNKYLKKLVIFTLMVGALSLITAYYMPQKLVSPAIPYLILFFFIIATVTYYLALRAFTQKTSRYANFFMISVFAKLLLYVFVIIIYAFINTGDIVNFIIHFFVFYLLFTVFETIEIIKAQKLKQ